MFSAAFRRLNNSLAGGAIIIAFFSIISKVLGLFRDRLLAYQFGANADLDVYFAAFKIPDFIFNILILGALSSAFIPVFQRVYHKDAMEGVRLSNSVLNILLLGVAGICLVTLFNLTFFVTLLVPGFTIAQIHETVDLTKIMLLSILFFTFSNIISGVLNAWKRFFTFSISSVVYNLGIIFGIAILYPYIGLTGLAWGVVLGSSMHLGVQLIEAYRRGWTYQPIIAKSREMTKIFTLMGPRAIGTAATQINLVIMTTLASSLTVGSLSVFSLASNLQSFPSSIFGVSLAVAAFPHFSQYVNEQKHEAFNQVFSTQFRRILFFILPISVLIVILRAQLVRVILGSGSFDWNDTVLTANCLGIFALSIFAQGLLPLTTQAFYAHEDTKTPVIIGLLSTLVNIILAYVLVKKFAVLGLTAAFTIASILYLITLLAVLKIKLKSLDETELIVSAMRVGLASVTAGLAAYGTLYGLSLVLNTHTFIGIFLQGLGAGCIGLLSYLIITIWFNFPEVQFARKYMLKFTRQLQALYRHD